jgi:drug/metabolite transporter (DMT)-like permease
MNAELFVAILAGLGGMLGWGLADFFAKKTIDQIGDIVALAWAHVFGTGVLVGVAVYRMAVGHAISLPRGFHDWLLLLSFGVAQAVIYILVYRGFGKGQVGLLAPLFACFSGLTAILSITIFGEPIRGLLPVALLLIFGGVLLITADAAALRARRFSFAHIAGFKEVAFATVLAAFWTLFWDRFVGDKDWLGFALWMYVFMTLAILAVAAIQRIKLRAVRADLWKYLALIGACETGAYLAITLGYSDTRFTSVVAILSGAFALPTIILARVFLRERPTTFQTIGGVVVIVGIVLLAAFRQL